jgi:hypothetical protein
MSRFKSIAWAIRVGTRPQRLEVGRDADGAEDLGHARHAETIRQPVLVHEGSKRRSALETARLTPALRRRLA